MLELRDLVKHYHVGDAEPVRAVDGVSLSIAAGELVALYGPSGSGKTTLLMLIAALIEPDGGAVLVAGRDLAGLTDAERSHYRLRELGFVDQTSDLLPGGNVVQNAAMKLWLFEHTRDAEHRIEPLLVRLGLGDRLAHRADQLSMGERQRVMIARALSTGPKVVLADEPTGNLDSKTSGEILDLLRTSAEAYDQTIVMVTHEPHAAAIADRILFLADGLIVKELSSTSSSEVLEVMSALAQ